MPNLHYSRQRIQDVLDVVLGRYQKTATESDVDVESSSSVHRSSSDSEKVEYDVIFNNAEKLEPPVTSTVRQYSHLLISLLLFVSSLLFQLVSRSRIDAACISLSETWHPLSGLVQNEWRQFQSESCPDEFCGKPNKRREDAWKGSWDLGWDAFPRDKLHLIEKSPDVNWLHLLPPKDENMLVSMPGVIHQLHCLSLIRETIYIDDFDYTGYINSTKDARLDWHVNHCLFALDIVFRCKADVSPVVLEEIDESLTPSSELTSRWRLRDPVKRCRRFEPIRDSFADNAICSSFCSAPEIYGYDEEHGHVD